MKKKLYFTFKCSVNSKVDRSRKGGKRGNKIKKEGQEKDKIEQEKLSFGYAKT